MACNYVTLSGQVASDPKVTVMGNSPVARLAFKMRSKVDGAWGRVNQKEYLRRYGTDIIIWVLKVSSSAQKLASQMPLGTQVFVSGSLDYWLSELKTVDDKPISVPAFFIKADQIQVLKVAPAKRMSSSVVTISRECYERVKDMLGDDGVIFSQEEHDKQMERLRQLADEPSLDPG